MSIALFAYGSLVNRTSLEQTLGGSIEKTAPARLQGWRRRWSLARDNLRCEKTFARAEGGEPPLYVLSLNLERDEVAGPPNGLLAVLDPFDSPEERSPKTRNELAGSLRAGYASLERLDRRELRYDRVEVTDQIEAEIECDRVFTYIAKPRHFAPEPPPDAVVLASYLRAVEAGFTALGPGELGEYERTTSPPPVEVIEAVLTGDQIPAGNPRAW